MTTPLRANDVGKIGACSAAGFIATSTIRLNRPACGSRSTQSAAESRKHQRAFPPVRESRQGNRETSTMIVCRHQCRGRVGELGTSELHAVAGVAGEADGGVCELFRRAWRSCAGPRRSPAGPIHFENLRPCATGSSLEGVLWSGLVEELREGVREGLREGFDGVRASGDGSWPCCVRPDCIFLPRGERPEFGMVRVFIEHWGKP